MLVAETHISVVLNTNYLICGRMVGLKVFQAAQEHEYTHKHTEMPLTIFQHITEKCSSSNLSFGKDSSDAVVEQI